MPRVERKFLACKALCPTEPGSYAIREIVQTRRNTKAAKRLLRRLLKKRGMALRRIINDRLSTYGTAKREVMSGSTTGRIRAWIIGLRIRMFRCESESR
jgi:transposase-like protein